jgi:surface polysaccharide O-acyltransferase-like enzyme
MGEVVCWKAMQDNVARPSLAAVPSVCRSMSIVCVPIFILLVYFVLIHAQVRSACDGDPRRVLGPVNGGIVE